MKNRLLIGWLALVAASGCGRSEPAQQGAKTADPAQPAQQAAQQTAQGAQQTAQGAQQMAQGMQQFAQGLQQMAQSQTKPIDFELLKALLPEIAGWTKSRARGEQVNMPFAISNAKAHYTNGDSSMEVTITDSALNQLIFAPFTMFMASGFEERSDDGYKKASMIAGSPGFEEWQKDSKHGEVTAVVGNRFIVQATGDNVPSIDPLRKAVEAVDLPKLATMK